MKKRWLIIIGIVLLSLAIGFIVWKSITEEEKYFRPITIGNENIILNSILDKPYIDTAVYAFLKYLEVDSTIVVIRSLTQITVPPNMIEYDLKARLQNQDNQYILWLSDMSRENSLKTLSHEFVHFKQYYSKEFSIRGENIQWLGKPYSIVNMRYQEYPWEIQAFSLTPKYYQDILLILY